MKVSGFNTEPEDWSNFSLYFEVIIVGTMIGYWNALLYNQDKTLFSPHAFEAFRGTDEKRVGAEVSKDKQL